MTPTEYDQIDSSLIVISPQKKLAIRVKRVATIKRLRYIHFLLTLDDFVFKICYLWTAFILANISGVVACKLLDGGSFMCVPIRNLTINCDSNNLTCYEDNIFIEPADLITSKDDSLSVDSSTKESRRYQRHYPWVHLLFLMHAFNFYLPQLLWKSYESGYFRSLNEIAKIIDNKGRRDLKLCHIAQYFLRTRGRHNFYASAHILVGAWNFIVLVVHTVWLTRFFDVTGIPKSLPIKRDTWSDFENFYFPSVGVCEIYSPVNDTMDYTACALSLNPLYMKMYLFFYTWYISLAILCGIVLVYRIALLKTSFRSLIINSYTSPAQKTTLESLCRWMLSSDWFLLCRLQNRMTHLDFAQMIDIISFWAGVFGKNKDVNQETFVSENGMENSDASNETVLPE